MARKIISVEIETTDTSGKNRSTNVGYVNLEATDEQLVEFAQKIAALLTDTYVGATKITKESLI